MPSDGLWRPSFPRSATVGPWGGDRGQGERFQGGVGGLGMPPLLRDRLPNFEGPGQRGVPRSPGAPCGASPDTHRRHLFLLIPSPGPLPPALTLSPASSPSPLKCLDCGALDTSAAFVPGFPGLSLCTSGRGPYLVFTHTSFVFPSSLIQSGNLK